MSSSSAASTHHETGTGTRDHYSLLGVARDASPSTIRSAYRRLAREHHPDKNPGDPGAERRFQALAEAYAVLSDPERRRRYDAGGDYATRTAGYSFADADELFRSVFGGADPFSAYHSFASSVAPFFGVSSSAAASSSTFRGGYSRTMRTQTFVHNGRRVTRTETTVTHPDGRVETETTESHDDPHHSPHAPSGRSIMPT
jgi:DnaJ-class molecular chaperone